MKKFMDLDQQLFQDVWQTYYDPSELEVKGKQLCVCGPKPYDPAGAGRNKNVLLAPAAPVQGDELVTVRAEVCQIPARAAAKGEHGAVLLCANGGDGTCQDSFLKAGESLRPFRRREPPDSNS